MPAPAEWLGREIADPGRTDRYGRVDDVFVGEQNSRPESGIVTVTRMDGGDGVVRKRRATVGHIDSNEESHR